VEDEVDLLYAGVL